MKKYFEIFLFTLISLVVIFIANVLDTKVFINLGIATLSFSILVSLCGISKYNSLVPGVIAGIAFGIIGGGPETIVVELTSILMTMICYKKLLHSAPLSPLNVYKSSVAGVFCHSLLSFVWLEYVWYYLFIEMIVALLIIKSVVNILREEGLINHEDPKLVAKIERDYLSLLYNKINKVFNTNLQRPIKPKKGEINQ